MRIAVFPERIDFHSGKPTARICVSKLIRFDPDEGFVRVAQSVWFVPQIDRHQCRLKPGLYEIRTEDGNEFIILLPQRIGVSVDVARELLQNPPGMPQPVRIPHPYAKAMTDLIANGLSWVAATRAVGLGPNAELPVDPFTNTETDNDRQ
jgi:hypothetical protein